MTSKFKTGLKTGLAIYIIGTVLTIIIHLIFGWVSPHSPPSSFLVIIFTIVIGGLRFLINVKQGFLDGSVKAKGEMMVHAAIAFLIIAFLLSLRYLV